MRFSSKEIRGRSMECGCSRLRGTWGFTSLFCLLLGRFQILHRQEPKHSFSLELLEEIKKIRLFLPNLLEGLN